LGAIVSESVTNELKLPAEGEENGKHETQYGNSIKPFGALRTAAVEFIADLY
jgi:hypothetical protein